MNQAALDGVRVLDFTHHVAGPYCTKLLADFGADVVKVERPGGGDPARRMGPFVRDEPHLDMGLPFLYLNTSKRGVTLNLKSNAGREIALKLAAHADVVVENFSPRVMPSLGLDYDAIQEVNPDVIMVSISNFGQSGPYRDHKATEIVEYALGGMAYIFGGQDREPLVHAYNQAQYKAGTNAASAAAIAVFHRMMTGPWRVRGPINPGVDDYRPAGHGVRLHLPGRHKGQGRNLHRRDAERPPTRRATATWCPSCSAAWTGPTWRSSWRRPTLADERFSTADGRRDNTHAAS